MSNISVKKLFLKQLLLKLEKLKFITAGFSRIIYLIFSVENIWLHAGIMHDNSAHKHFAIQLTLSLDEPFEVHFGNKHISAHSVLIKNNVEHSLHSDNELLIMLFNPVSTFGHYLTEILDNQDWMVYEAGWLSELQPLSGLFFKNEITGKKFLEAAAGKIADFKCTCEIENHYSDERIHRAIQYLEEHSHEIVPVEEIASVCSLSEGRFIHLFKEKTGITYRRFQLWNKLLHAGKCIIAGMNMTDSAHEAGFADSAHFSRTFKETFGALPKNILS